MSSILSASTTAPFECSQVSDIGTRKEYLSLVGFGDSGEDIKHSRFAGAVWTNHAKLFYRKWQ
jgi:hypothetical protein